MDGRRLAEAPREGLVAHERLVVVGKLGCVFAQPAPHTAVAPEDFTVRPEAEAVVHVTLQILQKTAEADTRLVRRSTYGKGRA